MINIGVSPRRLMCKKTFSLIVFILAAGDVRADPTDQILVDFEELYSGSGASSAQANRVDQLGGKIGVALRLHRVMTDNKQVLILPKKMPLDVVRQITDRIARLPGIKSAEPDPVFFPAKSPNDVLYSSQWNYSNPIGGANLPMAWDITTGNSRGNLAVIDTGILPHTDLASRFLTGYDFVTSVVKANDGNARDSDPSDPGNWVSYNDTSSASFSGCPVVDSDWHGTHVSGIAAGATNNSVGVAGTSWGSKIVPVRVLGKCGGSMSDIIDGTRWAFGLPVAGVPANANPVRILNLSLGGRGPCSSSLQATIDDVVKRGGVLVVAAGNDATDAGNTQPANCKRVITVAATNTIGGLAATYSNFGASISLSAPGGEGVASGAILSTGDLGIRGPLLDNAYVRQSGTSMATPMVSGTASLMLSVNDRLIAPQVSNILRQTARSFPNGTGSDCTTTKCGSGILNASSAVRGAYSSISAGFDHSVGLKADGTVWAWGDDSGGQASWTCFTPAMSLRCLTPTPVITSASGVFGDVKAIAAGAAFSLALKNDGTVWAWGYDSNGQIGTFLDGNNVTPIQVPGISGVRAIGASASTSFALKSDGTVWAWGSGEFGNLGDGIPYSWENRFPVPKKIPGLSGIVAIHVGDSHSFAIDKNGVVYAWGRNTYGAFGNGTTFDISGPTIIPALQDSIMLQAGYNFSLALKVDGSVWAWGLNTKGQLGLGTVSTSAALSPVRIPGLSGVNTISAGKDHAMAVLADGTVYAWGNNYRGKLGDGTTVAVQASPVKVKNLDKAIHIDAGEYHSLTIQGTGGVGGWGDNDFGPIGNGTYNNTYLVMQRSLGSGGTGYLSLF